MTSRSSGLFVGIAVLAIVALAILIAFGRRDSSSNAIPPEGHGPRFFLMGADVRHAAVRELRTNTIVSFASSGGAALVETFAGQCRLVAGHYGHIAPIVVAGGGVFDAISASNDVVLHRQGVVGGAVVGPHTVVVVPSNGVPRRQTVPTR